jgi:hypothetical protein
MPCRNTRSYTFQEYSLDQVAGFIIVDSAAAQSLQANWGTIHGPFVAAMAIRVIRGCLSLVLFESQVSAWRECFAGSFGVQSARIKLRIG